MYDGKRLEEGPVPMNDKQRRVYEDIRDLIVERFGSTGVQEALSRAVDQARVLVVFPVKSIHTFVASEGVFSDGNYGLCIVRFCSLFLTVVCVRVCACSCVALVIRQGTTFGEVAAMISGQELDYCECGQTGQRVAEDAVVTQDNNVVRFVFRDMPVKKKEADD